MNTTTNSSRDQIGLWPLTSLVTGNLVGSGAFLLPATLAVFGTISLYGWAAATGGAILLSLVFASLSSRVTKTGGPYQYARAAFGDSAAFYVAWGYWMLSWISNAALPIAAAGYISLLVGGLAPEIQLLIEVFIVLAIASFNLLGLKLTGRAELIITSTKVIPLLILPSVGLLSFDSSIFLQHMNTTGQTWGMAVSSATFIALWSFVGLETGTVPAGQVRSPERTVPRATILGTCIAAAVYILGAVVILGVVPPELLLQSKAPYAEAAHIIFGGTWGAVVATAAIVSCLGTLNGWTIVVGRIPYGAAQDGLFPEIFARTTRHGTPYWGVIISTICSLPLLFMSLHSSLMEQFNFIVDVAVTLILLIYLVCIVAYGKMLHESGDMTVGRVAMFMCSLLFVGWALWAAGIKMVVLSLVIVFLGLALYLWMRNRSLKPVVV